MNKKLAEILNRIKTAKSIAIFSHTNPDGDALGSVCAFFSYCKSVGKKADIFIDDNYKSVYKNFLPNVNEIRCDKVEFSYELLICLDTPSLAKLGIYGSLFKKHPNAVRIDHHAGDFGLDVLSYVDSKKSSVCEMLYDVFKTLKTTITTDMATCLMTGLLTDTGSLIHSNASASSFKVCAELVRLGAKREVISEQLFKSTPLNVVKLKAHLLGKFEIVNGNIAFGILTLKEFNQFSVKISDIDGMMVDNLLNIDVVKYAIFVYETMPQFFNINLRGKIGHNVRDFAITLGGGGHNLASGARMRGTATEVRENILTAAKEELK